MNRKTLTALMLEYKALMQGFDALDKYKPPFTETEREEIRNLLNTRIKSVEIDLTLLQSFAAGDEILATDLENKFFEFALEDILNGMQIQLFSQDQP
jgi:hypothetical protein